MDKFTIPYGLEWDADDQKLRCRICYPAHTYVVNPIIQTLDDWLNDDNIKRFLTKHQHKPATGQTMVNEKLKTEALRFSEWRGWYRLGQEEHRKVAALMAEFAASRDLEIARLTEALRHYADESFWDDPLQDSGYAKETQYNYEDEMLGTLPGWFIAQDVLRQSALGTAAEVENGSRYLTTQGFRQKRSGDDD